MFWDNKATPGTNEWSRVFWVHNKWGQNDLYRGIGKEFGKCSFGDSLLRKIMIPLAELQLERIQNTKGSSTLATYNISDQRGYNNVSENTARTTRAGATTRTTAREQQNSLKERINKRI